MRIRFGRSIAGMTAVLAVSFLGLSPAAAQLAPDELPAPAVAERIPDSFIVKLRDNEIAQRVADLVAQRTGGEVRHVFSKALKGFSIRLPRGASIAGLLAAHGGILRIEPNLKTFAVVQEIPTGISRSGADAATGVDCSTVNVAVIDSGVDVDHEDLNVAGSVNFVADGQADGNDLDGHGTHVAGTIAAIDNDVGVTGVCPGANIYGLRALAGGTGSLADAIAALDWVTARNTDGDPNNNINVVNMSLSAVGFVSTFEDAAVNAVNSGAVVVVAAGNDSNEIYGANGRPDVASDVNVFWCAFFGVLCGDDTIPAAYPSVATVSALGDLDGQPGGTANPNCVDFFFSDGTFAGTQCDDTMAFFSNFNGQFGAEVFVNSPGGAIDVAAPGVSILSTWNDGGYATISGTSMASPHVAGAAAAYIAANGPAVDAAGVTAIRQALIDTAEPQSLWGPADTGDTDGNPEGLLDVFAAVGGPAGDPPTTNDAVASGLEDGGAIAITLTGADTDGFVASFSVSSAPANGVLSTDAGGTSLVIPGADMAATVNEDLTLYFTPNQDWNGQTTFPFAATDNDGLVDTSAATATITVDPVNDAPDFTASEPVAVNEDAGGQTLNGWASFDPGPADESGQSATYSVSNVSSAALFASPPAVDASGNLTYTPAAGASGTSTFDVDVQDDGGVANGGVDTSLTQTFTITVNAVNDEPGFTASNPAAVGEDAGPQTVNNWATFDAGAPEESGQAVVGYLVSNVGTPGLFAAGPSVDANGTLTFTPAPDAFGASTFDVQVQDDGGVTNGGDDTSQTQTFTITVDPVNDAPDFVASNPPAVNEDSGAQTVSNWATFDAGPANESGQAVLAYTVSGISNAGLFSSPPSVDSAGTLRYTSATDGFGISTFDVRVQDDGGTPNGGDDTSGTQTFTITVNAAGDPPTTDDVSAGGLEDGGAIPITLTGGDTDPGGSVASFSVLALPVGGVLSTDPGGSTSVVAGSDIPAAGNSLTLYFTPEEHWNGEAAFPYAATDNDGVADATPATATITVTAVQDLPVADAGEDQTVLDGAAVSLDGSGSSDPDGPLASYSWTSNGAEIATGVAPAPIVLAVGVHTVTLTVTDADGAEATDDLVVTVHQAPVADAGSDQTVTENDSVTLDGSGSVDPDGGPLTFSWTQDGTPVASTASVTVGPFATGLQIFDLTVTDQEGVTATDRITIAVVAAGQDPNVIPGATRVPADQTTIQAAIDAASNSETILVSPGLYVENIDFLGKAITVISEFGPDVTIIDGDASGTVVTFASGEGPATVLSGFTVRNGSAQLDGSGMNIESSSPTVEHNKIIDNVGCSGIGIDISFGSPVIRDNEISGNVQVGCSTGGGGGGIAVRGSGSAQIIDNLISDNVLNAAGGGGGIHLNGAGTPVIRGNIIRDNSVSGTTGSQGGGIALINVSDALIVQNLIVGNSASVKGGGIAWLVPSSGIGPSVVNNTLADNTATQGSSIFADGFDAQARLINNIIIDIAGNTALRCGDFGDQIPPIIEHNNVYSDTGIAYEGVCADQTGLNGNIAEDPLFVDQPGGDYRLSAGSPAMEAGDNAAPGLPLADLSGYGRIADGDTDGTATIDMGAYEFGDGAVANAGPDQSVTDRDVVTLDGSGSTDPDGGALTYDWSLDGAPLATGPTPAIGVLAAGSHDILLTVTDVDGVDTTDIVTVTVQAVNQTPIADAGSDAAIGTGETAVLDGTGSFDPDGDALTYVWMHNGTQIGTGPTPTVGPFAAGEQTITLTVTDPFGASHSDTVILAVAVPPNVAPSFTAGTDQTVSEDAGPQTVANWATGISAGSPEEAGQTLSFNVSNDNNGLFSGQPSIQPDGTLTYTPAANANGSATVTVTLSDDGGTANGGVDTSAPQNFVITVNPVNDAPDFTASSPVAVNEDAGPQTINAWASFDPGPANESGQTATYTVNVTDNAALFLTLPSVNAAGALTYTPAAGASGTATFDVFVQDSGGMGNGGLDTSATKSFTVTVNPVNDEPSFTASNPAAVAEDSGPQSIANWALFDAGAPEESGQAALGYTVSSVSNPGLFSAGPSVAANGTLSYTPADNAFGSSTFDVQVQDDGGVANGGDDTSATQTFTITVSSVNDAPTTNNAAANGVENAASIEIVLSGADIDGSVASFVLSNLPANGTLFTDPGLGTQAQIGVAYAATSDTRSLFFVPNAEWFGLTGFDYAARDNGGVTDATPASASIDVAEAPAVDTIHVGDLDGQGANTAFWRWAGTVTVTVHDSTDAPVANAVVSGAWSGPISASGQCTTNAGGTCTITSPNIWIFFGNSVTFTVQGVTGGTYDSGANHDPDGDSNGTSIAVSQP